MFLRRALKRLAIDGEVKQRLKREPQILSKLSRQTVRLSQIEDIGGCRVIVPSVADVRAVQQEVASSKRSSTKVTKIDDYIAHPRPGGYRAVHLHTVRDGMKIEIQLRTKWQHMWAEEIERFDREFGTDLKHERGPQAVYEAFKILADLRDYYDQNRPVPSELQVRFQESRRTLQELFPRGVMTP